MTLVVGVGREQLDTRASRAGSVAAEFADEIDRQGRFPQEAVEALRRERLMGVMAPAELGGEGAGLGHVGRVCRTLGAACASTAMIYAMHQIKMSVLLGRGELRGWRASFARRVAEEQLLLASATSEAGVGGDLRHSVCAIEPAGDAFSVEKQATVISYGSYADAILLSARRDPEAASSEQVMAVLTRDQMELERTAVWDALGMRGTCSDGFRLRGSAPARQILPEPFGEIAATTMTAVSHVLWSSVWYGIAAGAVARAQAFVIAAARKSPGSTPPGATPLAEAIMTLQTFDAGILKAVDRVEAARQTREAALDMTSMVMLNNLKVSSSRAVLEIVDACMMVCGLAGYRNSGPYSLGRQLRDAHSARLMISNDRIVATTSALLPALRSNLVQGV